MNAGRIFWNQSSLGCVHTAWRGRGGRGRSLTSCQETKGRQAAAGRPQGLRGFSLHTEQKAGGPDRGARGHPLQHRWLCIRPSPERWAQVRPLLSACGPFPSVVADPHGQGESLSSAPSQKPWTLALPFLQGGPWRVKPCHCLHWLRTSQAKSPGSWPHYYEKGRDRPHPGITSAEENPQGRMWGWIKARIKPHTRQGRGQECRFASHVPAGEGKPP